LHAGIAIQSEGQRRPTGLLEVAIPEGLADNSLNRYPRKDDATMMEYFFKPKSVAVIGASTNPKKLGYVTLDNIVKSDFSGDVYPINPSAEEICGFKAYPSLNDVPGPVDLVIMLVPAKLCLPAMEDCARKGVKAVIIEAMGFSEVGGEGINLQNRIVDIARQHNIRVMGPNCSGIVSRAITTSFYAMGREVPNGNVVLIGQSGLLAAGMAADIVVNQTLSINKVCSIGNKCDVNENDLLEYFGEDDQTQVISMYLESVSNGRELVRIARKVAARKPVIFLNGGRTDAGAKAAMSHTGSIASNAKIVEAAIRQTGMIGADDFTELKDFAKVFSTQPIPTGNRVAVVTAAGSVGVVVSDLCAEHGLELPKLTPATIESLKDVFAEDMPPSNPVDLYYSIAKIGLTKTLETTLAGPLGDDNIDAVVLILAGFEYTLDPLEKKTVQTIVKKFGKPVVICMLVGYNEYKNRIMEELGKDLPVFTSLISGVKALSKLCEYGIRRQKRAALGGK
jgi:acetate---CoA ligase (ADP-forming)